MEQATVIQIIFIFILLLMIALLLITIVRLNRQRAIAEERNNAKSNFLAIMSHEIRTPMNAIIGISEMELMESSALSEKSRDALARIYNSGHSLLAIINDILDLSKIESGKLELFPVEYDTAILISDTAQLNLARKGEKPIEFFLNVDKELPARLFGDEVRIRQILNNILSNAFKYTDKGFVRLEVEARRKNGEIYIIYKIADSGQGLKPEHLNKLFAEYSRFNTEANRDVEGTGLGMSITRRLLNLMDGEIDIVSEFGVGSIFTVTIKQPAIGDEVIGPQTAALLNAFRFVASPTTVSITREHMPYARVLIVDDVEVNLFVAKGLLIPYGIQVETASSGKECLEKIKEDARYSLILMDHMMPIMDGIETTKRLRKEFGFRGPIIALTANAVVGAKNMFKNNDFDDFLSKPIDIRRLNAILNQYIRDRQNEETLNAAKEQRHSFDEFRKTESSYAQMLRIFKRDARRAVVVLTDSAENSDFKLFTITAHAMKSALANIGKDHLSLQARLLEEAGNEMDFHYIENNLGAFLDAINEILNENTDTVTAESVEAGEDKAFLAEQLDTIYAACENYDTQTADAAIKLLLEKPFQADTIHMIEDISELILYSDFEAAQIKVKEAMAE